MSANGAARSEEDGVLLQDSSTSAAEEWTELMGDAVELKYTTAGTGDRPEVGQVVQFSYTVSPQAGSDRCREEGHASCHN